MAERDLVLEEVDNSVLEEETLIIGAEAVAVQGDLLLTIDAAEAVVTTQGAAGTRAETATLLLRTITNALQECTLLEMITTVLDEVEVTRRLKEEEVMEEVRNTTTKEDALTGLTQALVTTIGEITREEAAAEETREEAAAEEMIEETMATDTILEEETTGATRVVAAAEAVVEEVTTIEEEEEVRMTEEIRDDTTIEEEDTTIDVAAAVVVVVLTIAIAAMTTIRLLEAAVEGLMNKTTGGTPRRGIETTIPQRIRKCTPLPRIAALLLTTRGKQNICDVML